MLGFHVSGPRPLGVKKGVAFPTVMMIWVLYSISNLYDSRGKNDSDGNKT